MKNFRVFFLSEKFQFLEVKLSIYLNRRVFLMVSKNRTGRKFDNNHNVPNRMVNTYTVSAYKCIIG